MPLPPKIDPSVTMMQVEEKPDVTYDDVGGCKEQIDKLREVVEMPLLNVSFRMGWSPLILY
jgi:26S proteasome regulatory subunit T1